MTAHGTHRQALRKVRHALIRCCDRCFKLTIIRASTIDKRGNQVNSKERSLIFVERYVASDSVNAHDCLNRDYKISSVDERSAVTLEENESRHIKWALENTRGKIYGPGGAAELLAIHPNTLAFRMKKMGIKKTN